MQKQKHNFQIQHVVAVEIWQLQNLCPEQRRKAITSYGQGNGQPLWSGYIRAHVIKLEKYNDDVASPIKQKHTQNPITEPLWVLTK